MTRPPDLMFPFVGGKRRMRGIVCVVIGAFALINAVVGAITVFPALLVPGLVVGGPFLYIGIDSLRPSVLLVREIDVLIAWSPRSGKPRPLQGISHAQATTGHLRLDYVANPDLPLEWTLKAEDFIPSHWWPMVFVILDRAKSLNPGMSCSLTDDLSVLPLPTAADLAAFRHVVRA